jgi:N-carbamoyl-L-amino-acid hydrolase
MLIAEKLFSDIARRTADTEGVTREPYGPGEELAYGMVEAVAKDFDLECKKDKAGNLYMTLPGRDRSLPVWMAGSHLDSVPKGGNFDGAAGVVSPLSVAVAMRRAGIVPRRDITVMAIRAEETGSWFSGKHGGHLGSRMALGMMRPEELEIAVRVDSGRTLAQHMADCHCDVEAIRSGYRHLDPEKIRGFIELHIEQGPVLENRGVPLGIVTGIRGNSRLRNPHCIGEWNHGGATPQEMRRDAVIAVSELVMAIDAEWRALHAQGRDLVFTVGKFWTDTALHSLSKVPGRANFSLDLRSVDTQTLDHMRHFVVSSAREIAARRKVRFELGEFSVTAPWVLDADLRKDLARGAQELGIQAVDIASGGGHDAADFGKAGVPSAMIFVRNANGSHNHREAMSMEDFALGTRLLASTIAGS